MANAKERFQFCWGFSSIFFFASFFCKQWLFSGECNEIHLRNKNFIFPSFFFSSVPFIMCKYNAFSIDHCSVHQTNFHEVDVVCCFCHIFCCFFFSLSRFFPFLCFIMHTHLASLLFFSSFICRSFSPDVQSQIETNRKKKRRWRRRQHKTKTKKSLRQNKMIWESVIKSIVKTELIHKILCVQ